MTANGSIDIAGTLTYSGDVDQGVPVAISQVLSEVETKKFTLTIPPGGAYISIPLLLSTGVTEALFLYLYTPAKLLVKETTNDGLTPGPQAKGLLGVSIWTYTPTEGLTGLQVANPDPINSVSLTVLIGAAPDSSTIPPFWVT